MRHHWRIKSLISRRVDGSLIGLDTSWMVAIREEKKKEQGTMHFHEMSDNGKEFKMKEIKISKCKMLVILVGSGYRCRKTKAVLKVMSIFCAVLFLSMYKTSQAPLSFYTFNSFKPKE